MPAAGLVGGGVAANVVSSKLLAKLTFIPDNFKPAVPIVLGLFLSTQKNKMLANVGCGMIAVGGAKLIGGFVPSINGITEADIAGMYDNIRISDEDITGAGDVLTGAGDVLNGPSDVLNGMDDDITGTDELENY